VNAIELLKKDHRTVEQLFQRFNDGGGLTGVVKRLTGNSTPPQQRRQVADRICAELDTHALIEEEVFYPAVRQLGDPQLNEQLDEANREHSTIKQRVQAVRTASDDEGDLRNAVTSLQECVDHHVKEEEREMFPMVEDRMKAAELARLGRDLSARKRATAPAKRPAAAARTRKTSKRTAPATASRARRMRKTTAKSRKRSSGSARKKVGGRR
jgi:iron-sulfur cluster repair protein YtfE (RIC family)